MKHLLKELYGINRRDFNVWNYLWLFSNELNSIQFSHTELCDELNISLPLLGRIMNKYPQIWNEDKIFVEYEKVGYKEFKVTFYPKGKKENKKVNKDAIMYDELLSWLKEYYIDMKFDYPELVKHKALIKTICGKVKIAMNNKNIDVTDESISSTVKLIFNNIPEWWIENGNITLPTINKSFSKILNQIKSSNAGKKRDSYSKAAESISSIDFSKLTAK